MDMSWSQPRRPQIERRGQSFSPGPQGEAGPFPQVLKRKQRGAWRRSARRVRRRVFRPVHRVILTADPQEETHAALRAMQDRTRHRCRRASRRGEHPCRLGQRVGSRHRRSQVRRAGNRQRHGRESRPRRETLLERLPGTHRLQGAQWHQASSHVHFRQRQGSPPVVRPRLRRRLRLEGEDRVHLRLQELPQRPGRFSFHAWQISDDPDPRRPGVRRGRVEKGGGQRVSGQRGPLPVHVGRAGAAGLGVRQEVPSRHLQGQYLRRKPVGIRP
ncbi:hypothetical protein EES43_24055 [Streptomyces sp. ADI96-02]|nr:hypothetical protein EES43_24055 [Streptomyces sp. ADI96-02]